MANQSFEDMESAATAIKQQFELLPLHGQLRNWPRRSGVRRQAEHAGSAVDLLLVPGIECELSVYTWKGAGSQPWTMVQIEKGWARGRVRFEKGFQNNVPIIYMLNKR